MHTTGNQPDHIVYILLTSVSCLRFILVDIGEAGMRSDGGVLSNSSFGQALEAGTLSIPDPAPLSGILILLKITLVYLKVYTCVLKIICLILGTMQPPFPYVFVGDEVFPLRPNMLRPYPGRNLTGIYYK